MTLDIDGVASAALQQNVDNLRETLHVAIKALQLESQTLKSLTLKDGIDRVGYQIEDVVDAQWALDM